MLSMVLIGGAINFAGTIEGSFLFFGEEALPVPALWILVGFSLVSGLVYMATRRRLITRPEMFFILFSSLIATPLMSTGFWRLTLGRMATIPLSSDFEKLDALNEKLWVHGANLTEGILESGQPSGFVGQGNLVWKRAEVDEGSWAELPTLVNSREDDFSSFEVELPLKPRDQWEVLPGQPHILSVLIQVREVEATSTYFCRVYTDDSRRILEEVFTGSGETSKTFLHKTGFQRFGMYGLVIPYETREKIRLEFGLSGKGIAVFRDLRLMNVSAINDAYLGTETITEAEYARLPETHRVGKKVRPDNLFSWKGIGFLLTAYVPLRAWIMPFSVWGSFLLCLLTATFSFSVIMRRQWVDRERFSLPLLQLPRFLIGFDGEGDRSKALPPIWTKWLMWAGLIPVFVWCLLRAWAASDPSIPDLSVNVSLKAYVTNPAVASMLGNVTFTIAALYLGLALFMDLNVSLSLILGYFLFRLQYWFGEAFGWNVEAGYPFQNNQIASAFLAYAALILVLGRSHLLRVLKEAIAGIRRPDEVFSSRVAILIFLSSFVCIVLWARWLDVPVRGMVLLFVIFFPLPSWQ